MPVQRNDVTQPSRRHEGGPDELSARPRQGKSLGGPAPYGYRYDESGRLVIDPREAPIRQLIFQLFMTHKRLKTVSQILHERGYRTRRGHSFSDTTIKRLIADPVTKGIRRAHYSERFRVTGRTGLKPPELWVTTLTEAIVSQETWNACNALLDRRRTTAPTKRSPHLFMGYAYCESGHRMIVKHRSNKYSCLKCGIKVVMTDLEEIFREHLRGVPVSPEESQEYRERLETGLTQKRALAVALAAEICDLRTETRVPRWSTGEAEDGPREFGSICRRLSGLDQLEAELKAVGEEIERMGDELHSSPGRIPKAEDLHSRWRALLFGQKRIAIESLLNRAIVGTDSVILELMPAPAAR